MLPSLIAALVPALTPALQPPELPAACGSAVVGVHLESTQIVAHNFAESPRWLVLRSGPFALVRALAPHGSVRWSFAESCLWDVQLEVLGCDGGRLQRSGRVELLAALESGAEALWVGEDSSSWLAGGDTLLPLLGEFGELAPAASESRERNREQGPLHVPVVRPSDRPEGDRPPPIDEKPLPPI